MKILIISHTSLNTHNNMGKTLSTLFSSFDRSELCQLYIYPMMPDVDQCDSYYRVTDKDVLKGLLTLHVNGREIGAAEIDTGSHVLFENPQDQGLYRNPKNKTALRVLLRDLMWKISPWYSSQLKDWVVRQKPTCIFVAPGVPKLLYDIAMRISSDFSLPIVTYICDDFYSVEPGNGLLEKLKQKLLVRKTEELFSKTAHLVAICDEIAEKYHVRFHVDTTTIMSGASFPVADGPVFRQSPQVMTYMGNIRYNRYLCLVEIGKALDEINRELGTDYQLHIYTIESNAEILAAFDGIVSVKLCGFVSGEEYDRVFRESEILIHTEAFDAHSMSLTQNSVSTKIADCLASGIPLFAYGPATIASMAHLIRNDCAVVVTEKDELKETVRKMFADSAFRYSKVRSGLETARRCHTGSVQSEKLKRILMTVR